MTTRESHTIYRVRHGDGCYLYRTPSSYPSSYYAWTTDRDQAKCFRRLAWAAKAAKHYGGVVEVGTSYERTEEVHPSVTQG